jgi:hypothetical protein
MFVAPLGQGPAYIHRYVKTVEVWDCVLVYDLVEEVGPEEWPGPRFQDLIVRNYG